MTEPKMKLCPFCGSKSEHPEAMIEDCVTCSNPDCPVWSFPFTKEQWNAPRPLEAQLLEACKAMEEWADKDINFFSSRFVKAMDLIAAAIAAAEGAP